MDKRRTMLGAGVLLVVVIAAAVGTMTLQHKPVQAARSELGGGGEIASVDQDNSRPASEPEASNQAQTKQAREMPPARKLTQNSRPTKPKSNSQPEAIPAPMERGRAAAAAPAPVQTEPAGPSEAEMNTADENLMKIRARMDAVHQSLANLKQQQAADGLGLRGDIAASESRLYSYFNMAERSLQQQNLAAAGKSMQHAEEELTKIEHFLGR